ncbi:prepilin-type N-terminal cleavage/methylation domain-containing protein [Geomonas oryzisoli]|uniref:Prepilin-type N-terminal cleavage/methylation domain-containing protein n=1 Tax=Geomonas oryzisoli TaxID=2847992 RepID=A0ABX8J4Z3_9BACT|nr:prepilin-type N-terminal cleavage/methylation domain-containing protein [Geomonas oryzisoli]QWV92032.1 prepilin-type N-terminal cleavage/methylation domain-containing protein [Geomonas oryzisoli]
MRQPTSLKNNSGFTLVELLVAMIIIAVGMFGVLQTINVSLQHNLQNEVRNEAVRIGQKYMADLRAKTFDAYSTPYTTFTENGKVRGVSKPYTVERTSQVLATDGTQPSTRQLMVTVRWSFKNSNYVNEVVTVVARP